MRIVYLNPSGQMGGAEVALLEMLASIGETQPEWKLDLIVSAEGPLAARARALGVATIVLPFPQSLARIGDASAGGPAGQGMSQARLLARLLFASAGIANYTRKMRRELRRLDVQVIHTNGFKMHILGALAKPASVPLIWHIHDYLSNRPFMVRLMKRFSRRCSIVLANSNSVKLDIENVCGNAVPIQTVYNSVDTSEFSPDGPLLDLDQWCGLQPPANSVVRIGMLATFARWKGHEVFLRALSLLPSDLAFRGYLIGDALYQTDGSQYSVAELKAVAKKLGVADRVGFTGFVAEPAAAMRSLDIVVHASTQPEPFGLVIIEGMACGRAVIASEAGGASELIDVGVNALGHTPGDANDLAQRIMELAADPALRARLGAAGRATVEQRFNRKRLATELIAIYRTVTAESVC